MKQITISTDGFSKGNPGPAAIAMRIVDPEGNVLQERVETIGNAYDDYAEYYAVLIGLQAAKEHFGEETKEIEFELSLSGQQTKKQLNNEETITHPGLVPFFIEIHNLRVTSFPKLKVALLRRKRNKKTSRLVKKALDA